MAKCDPKINSLAAIHFDNSDLRKLIQMIREVRFTDARDKVHVRSLTICLRRCCVRPSCVCQALELHSKADTRVRWWYGRDSFGNGGKSLCDDVRLLCWIAEADGDTMCVPSHPQLSVRICEPFKGEQRDSLKSKLRALARQAGDLRLIGDIEEPSLPTAAKFISPSARGFESHVPSHVFSARMHGQRREGSAVSAQSHYYAWLVRSPAYVSSPKASASPPANLFDREIQLTQVSPGPYTDGTCAYLSGWAAPYVPYACYALRSLCPTCCLQFTMFLRERLL